MILLFQAASEVAPVDISGLIYNTMGVSGLLLLAAIGYLTVTTNRLRKERDSKQANIDNLQLKFQEKFEKKDEQHNKEINQVFTKLVELSTEANADRREMMSLIKLTNNLMGANQDLLRDFSSKTSNAFTELAKAHLLKDK